MTKPPIGVFISGRGSNLKSIINASKDLDFPGKVNVVFSDNSDAKGMELAYENNIDAISLEIKNFKDKNSFEEEILKLIEPYNLELVCLAGYMKILSKRFIDKFTGKIINIHPSLLPKYKGLNTHRRAIENKETVAGCTVHYVNENLDDGEIILQKEVRIDINDTEYTLADKVLKEEHVMYPKAIKLILKK
tara:strand:- start:371 stop:943 length:573 start_codon:yes stop_codon:yes gene_type:complete